MYTHTCLQVSAALPRQVYGESGEDENWRWRDRGKKEDRMKNRSRVGKSWERERERGREILLIHRDSQRYHSNVVAIVTALLRMPLVGNKKRAPLTACMEHTALEHNITHNCLLHAFIHLATLTLKHSGDAHRHTCNHPHSFLPPTFPTTTTTTTHFTSQLSTRTAAATSPLPTQELKQMQTYTNLSSHLQSVLLGLLCNKSFKSFLSFKLCGHGSSRLPGGPIQYAALWIYWKQPKGLSDTHLSFIWFSSHKKHKSRACYFAWRRSTRPQGLQRKKCFLFVFWRNVNSLSHTVHSGEPLYLPSATHRRASMSRAELQWRWRPLKKSSFLFIIRTHIPFIQNSNSDIFTLKLPYKSIQTS